VEANSTGGQGSRRAVAPSDDDDIRVGRARRSWLRHRATRREVQGSSPGATQSFCPHSVALESIQPLTRMNTKESTWE
jgi:hypothetical protein